MKTLDIIECAAFLKIERTHALTLAGNGILPGAKIGRSWVFLESDVAEYLRAEAQKQMKERAAKLIEPAPVMRAQFMVMSPRAAARSASKRPRIDVSGYNDDGSPKTLKELAAAG